MKLRQRLLLLGIGSVASVLCSHFIIVTLTWNDHDHGAVKEIRESLQNQFTVDQRTKVYKFVSQLTTDKFRENSSYKTGNPLIDDYGKNTPKAPGEMGVAVSIPPKLPPEVNAALKRFQINVIASDTIPLNRLVPDSRFHRCRSKQYPHDLPRASVIVPFHDEWPSILKRTIYSIINRTPRHLLEEIVLVDDNSTLDSLKEELDSYIASMFPVGLVKLLRTETRVGLVRARMIGIREAKGEVIVIFDSHMEVNVHWLEPLLTQIKTDRTSFALGILDYVKPNTFEYDWHKWYLIRYGFDWRLVFFETFFRSDLYGEDDTVPKKGVVMVGAGFAVDRKYFLELGGYDEGMNVWGGENLELSWRAWLCGGSLVHLPCSKIGHIARSQPYSFPGGRRSIEVHNYKRAIEVWMEDPQKKIIYDYFPEMLNTSVGGDVTDRLELKKRLGCRNFSWFIDNVWPEMAVFEENSIAWGAVRNKGQDVCLDNHDYLFASAEPLYVETCRGKLHNQGFSLSRDGRLRSSLQCIVVTNTTVRSNVKLRQCITKPPDKWTYSKENERIQHVTTGLCLDICQMQQCVNQSICQLYPCVNTCSESPSQMWSFTHYV